METVGKNCIKQFHWTSGINSVIGVKIISVSLRVCAPKSQWCSAELQQDHLQKTVCF